MALPTFLPLPDAARELGLSVAELQARVDAGTIAAGRLPDGEIVVSQENIEINGASDINTRLYAIKRDDFKHLQGQAITVTEATEKYGLAGRTIRGWVSVGYVSIINPGGYPMKLDETDMAYCAAIHAVRKLHKSRAPLLDKRGRPYLLKHPELARARRIVNEERK